MSGSSLKSDIQEAMKAAMRAKEKERLGTIRLILAELKRIEVDERIELDNTRVLSILDKMLKQRRDSITQFEQAGRQELVEKEQSEMVVIQEFMPQALSVEEINSLVEAAFAQTGANSMKDMGKVMAILKPKLQGRADLGAVSAQVKSKLGS